MGRGRTITLTVVAWVSVVGLYANYYVKTILALPDLEEGYERDWLFQLLMFCLFRLPILMAGLVVLVVFELAAFKNKSKTAT